MKIPVWHRGMTPEQERDIAYAERNLLALRYADGWYLDKENDWPGYKRVLSLDGGKICFHIPDDFEVGDLPEIAPNWDGHTTEQKWIRVRRARGIVFTRENAHQCPMYRDAHIGGCWFSPSAQEAWAKGWGTELCLMCLRVEERQCRNPSLTGCK